MAVENISIEIKSNAEKEVNSLKDLRKEMIALKGELLELEQGTDEYNQKALELANTQHKLRDINEEARYGAADLGEQLATTNRIATGLASGFNAVQGAVALFGGESEALEKTMVKLQAGIAIVQGLQGMEGLIRDLEIAKIQFRGVIGGVKAFITSLKAMKTALISTGIGALVVAIGLLIANWDKISAMWNDTTPEDRAKRAVDDLNRALEIQKQTLTVKSTQALKAYTQALRDAAGDIDKIKEATDNFNAATQKQQLSDAEYKLSQLKIAEEKTYQAYIDLSYKKRIDSENEVVKAFLETKQKRIQAENELAKIQNKIELDKQNAIANERKERQNLHDEQVRQANERIKKAEEERNALIRTYKTLHDALIDSNLSEFDQAYTNLEVQYEEDLKILKTSLNNKIITREQYNQNVILLNRKLANDISALMDETSNNEAQKLREKLDDQIKIIEDKISELNSKASRNISDLDTNFNLTNERKEIDGTDTEQAKLERLQTYESQRISIIRNRITEENRLLFEQLALEHLTAEEKAMINDEILQNQLLLEQEEIASENRILQAKKNAHQAEVDSAKQKAQKALQVISASLQGASQLISALQANIDTTTEEGFEQNKKMQKAQTWINVASGIVAAVSSAMTIPPPVGPILAAINSAFVLATGIAQTAAIDKQTFNNPQPLGNASTTPNVSGSLLGTDIYGQQLGMSNDIELQSNTSSQKVYVVESDITDTQNDIKTKVDESTF